VIREALTIPLGKASIGLLHFDIQTAPFSNSIVTWPPLTCSSHIDLIVETMRASPKNESVQPRWRAVLRLVLGQVQVIGAVATFVLLVQGGVTVGVVCGVALSGLASLVSLLLFHVIWKEKPRS
jgi:hypothetical protein